VAWAAVWMALWSVLGTDPEAPVCPAELLRVARGTNANVVVYEARFASTGALDGRDPVHATWLMVAADGHREELNVLGQGLAYGFDIRRVAGGGYDLRLHAQPDRPIGVRMRQGCPVAVAAIMNHESGIDPDDGDEAREVIPAN